MIVLERRTRDGFSFFFTGKFFPTSSKPSLIIHGIYVFVSFLSMVDIEKLEPRTRDGFSFFFHRQVFSNVE